MDPVGPQKSALDRLMLALGFSFELSADSTI